jgi:Phosphoenolpyruvate-protein kinase (PTS system EI component in bacteria)
MFPMIAEVSELTSARGLLDLELERAKRAASPCPSVCVLALCSKCLPWPGSSTPSLKQVDFISIGTNDLLQFLFAADRGNSRLAGRYDSLSPALLRLLHFVVEKVRRPESIWRCAARWRAAGRGAGTPCNRSAYTLDVAGRHRTGEGYDSFSRSERSNRIRGVGAEATGSSPARDPAAVRG